MAELLLGKGYCVAGTSRDPDAALASLPPPLKDAVEITVVDLRSTESIAALVHRVRPTEIYNFAAFSTGRGMFDDPVAMGDVNGLSVARMLEAIRSTDPAIRFCQASSSEMFGATTESPQREDTPFRPRSPYGAAKLFAHNLVSMARTRDGLFACSAILFNHESERRSPEFVTRKVTRAAAAVCLGLQSQVELGDLGARRDWGHSADAVRAMWLMLQADTADDFVVATGIPHSVGDLCSVAFGHLGLDWRQHVQSRLDQARAPDHTQLVGDAARARERLGWAPSIAFDDMIRGMVDHDLRQLKKDISQARTGKS